MMNFFLILIVIFFGLLKFFFLNGKYKGYFCWFSDDDMMFFVLRNGLELFCFICGCKYNIFSEGYLDIVFFYLIGI